MIYIIITSYNEPKSTLEAVRKFLSQKVDEDFKVIVIDPFLETEKFLRSKIKDKKFDFILDPGEGKTYALNMVFNLYYSDDKNDLFVFTDGDVFVSDNSLKEIIKVFKDKKIGCLTAKPIPFNSKNSKYGYWANLCYDGVDFVRKKLSNEGKFFQCSGYLFAIRNGIIREISPDVPEDCVIPYLVWKAGYRVFYLDNVFVKVKYPNNWSDWSNQRIRTIKAHENIPTILPHMPRTKSLFNEIKQGLFFSLKHPKNLKEYFWLFELYLARLYVYLKSFIEIKNKKEFDPAWRDYSEIKSAKPMD